MLKSQLEFLSIWSEEVLLDQKSVLQYAETQGIRDVEWLVAVVKEWVFKAHFIYSETNGGLSHTTKNLQTNSIWATRSKDIPFLSAITTGRIKKIMNLTAEET
jgi:hypothetical protein